MHDQSFLQEIAIALVAGLLGGLAARALRLPVLTGYLAAGVAIGPYTPGPFVHAEAVQPVANLGVVLLMFAVGVQFSLRELRAVMRTAVMGGTAQILLMIGIGVAIGAAAGWGVYGGLYLGCAIALSSTAVVMRLLEERGETGSAPGAIILGISIVQDLSLVLMVALLPALSGVWEGAALWQVAEAMGRAVLFIGVAILLATRVVPGFLHAVARAGSRELFLLTVVAASMLAGLSAERAGLGLPLGAFLAGLVISESEYAQDVFSQVRPLRDVFASLFFVSVGMLLDIRFVMENWAIVLVVILAILPGKALVTMACVYALGWHGHVSVLVGLALAQVGEFSFVLTTLGTAGGLIRPEIAGVILASALVTILLTPFAVQSAEPLYRKLNAVRWLSRYLNRGSQERVIHESGPPPQVILFGYGRAGRYVSDALLDHGVSHLVVDYDAEAFSRARERGVSVIYGDASSPSVLEKLPAQLARLALVALPDSGVTELVVRALRRIWPELRIIARVQKGSDIARMRAAGADAVIHGEFEVGTEMIRQSLERLGVSWQDIDDYLDRARAARYKEE